MAVRQDPERRTGQTCSSPTSSPTWTPRALSKPPEFLNKSSPSPTALRELGQCHPTRFADGRAEPGAACPASEPAGDPSGEHGADRHPSRGRLASETTPPHPTLTPFCSCKRFATRLVALLCVLPKLGPSELEPRMRPEWSGTGGTGGMGGQAPGSQPHVVPAHGNSTMALRQDGPLPIPLRPVRAAREHVAGVSKTPSPAKGPWVTQLQWPGLLHDPEGGRHLSRVSGRGPRG